jgi:hypothetical protein
MSGRVSRQVSRIGLVSCSKSKLSERAAARDLYAPSALFRGARCAVERSCAAWYVLSALHGLVHPDTWLEPYDDTLATASTAARRKWSRRVLEQINDEFSTIAGVTFECHAGTAYLRFGLVEGLVRHGASVIMPVEGLTQGRRLRYYKESGCL